MPVLEPVALSGDKLALRLIGPRAAVWPTSPAANLALLARSDLVARPIVDSQLPESADLVSGSYTLRLDDAGEAQFAFPNVIASDGVPYRQKFDPTGHLMFVEVYLDGVIEEVLCLDTVNPTDGRGFSSTLDATDFCASLWGNGAGIQNGSTGQLQAVVFDPATLQASLFDVQGWQDFSDAAFPSLLQGLLNSQLGLRLTPWQLLSADPSSGGGGGSVGVHGQDGWFLLKKAYERDWTVVMAPRDVVERGTQVWVPAIADDFPNPGSSIAGLTLTTPFTQWNLTENGGATAAVAPQGGLEMTVLSTASSVFANSPTFAVNSTGAWRALVSFAAMGLPTNDTTFIQVTVFESTGDNYQLALGPPYGGTGGPFAGPTLTIPIASSYGLMIESDGEWVWWFINGQQIGCARRTHTSTTSLQLEFSLENGVGAGGQGSVVVSDVLVESLRPLLMAGTDKGDYVLPGGPSTYPSGGLHGRYYNDADLQSDGFFLDKILAPSRSQAYSGSSTVEYQNQQDATINFTAPFAPTPGAANGGTGGNGTSNYSVKWFGAIWLELSKGDYGISFTVDDGVRVWIGKTRWGDQIIDSWQAQGATNYATTLHASSLAGNPGYGGSAVARDGWYPIIIEYFQGTGTANAQLFFTPPASYTDPGGTALTGGTQVIVPSTSLSPLGCVDQRYQGISHFDLVQQTVTAFGYQAAVEPYRFETLGLSNQPGYFPGQLAPRVREGHDTDLKLEPDKTSRQDWTGTLKPQLANSWPLPGTLAAMRWRPGDGIRVRDNEINVWDRAPRQILAFVRNLLPDGVASAVASLANRPRTSARTLKQQIYTVSRLQRNYQRQTVTLLGSYAQNLSIPANSSSLSATPASNTPTISMLALNPGDEIVSAVVRVSSTASPPSPGLGIAINGGPDVGNTLRGPWLVLPVELNLMPVIAVDASAGQRIYVAMFNRSLTTAATDVNFQLIVEVLR